MVGIKSFGAHIPFYRLTREEIARAWRTRSAGGQKAVAGHDEDSVTMAVAAGLECLKGFASGEVEGLFLATTTAPYKEKLSATIVATAADIPQQVHTADVTNSLRAGTTAMNFALDGIQSGRMNNIMVVASDTRMGAPRSDLEPVTGDAASALLLGDSEVIASVEGRHSISNEQLDVWRPDHDAFLRSWDVRYSITQGYNKVVGETVGVLLKKLELTPKDFDKVILYAPDARSHAALAKNLGFDPNTQLQNSLIKELGHTGVASPLLMLVAALEEAKPGDRILLASYGDGSDAFVLKVTEEITKHRDIGGIKAQLEKKTRQLSYDEYLLWRGLVPAEPLHRPDPIVPPASALRRDRQQILALYGYKCKRCGTPQYPQGRICVNCQAKDEFEDYKFSDKKATIYTFSQDYVNSPSDPPLIMCTIDFEGGGRMRSELTDHDLNEVKAGLPVEMTFRKLHDLKGIHHYFWKCKPLR
ncbi:hydroxymethylglutaryl-CoA synthase [Chloroflexota bacterium]